MVRIMTEQRNCGVTIATSLHIDGQHPPPSSALDSEFRQAGAHIFILPTFSALGDQPAFILHLIRSRRISHVFVLRQPLGLAIVEHLRQQAPTVSFSALLMDTFLLARHTISFFDGAIVDSDAFKDLLVKFGSYKVGDRVVVLPQLLALEQGAPREHVKLVVDTFFSFTLLLMKGVTLSRTLRDCLETVSRPSHGMVDMLEIAQLS